MKVIALLVVVPTMLLGCGSRYLVQADETEDAYSYSQVKDVLAGKIATIKLKDGTQKISTDISLSGDSTSFNPLFSREKYKIATETVSEIAVGDHLEGAFEGWGYGVGVGIPVGIFTWAAFSSGTTRQRYADLAKRTPITGGVFGLVGLLTGAILGHTNHYVFSPEIEHQKFAPKEPRLFSHTAYVDLTSLWVFGHTSINYEYMLNQNLALRTGFGLTNGLSGFFHFDDYAYGPLLMGLYLSPGKMKFEGGLGVCYMTIIHYSDPTVNRPVERIFAPAVAIGYRYVPTDSWMVFRAGVEWVYLNGFPIHISIGTKL